MADPKKYIIQMEDKDKETGDTKAELYPRTLAEAIDMGDGTALPQKLEQLKTDAANSVVYSNATPTVTSHGGIEVGETFDNVSIQDMLTKILYPYVAPTIGLSSTVTKGYKEIGTSFNATLTATAVKKSEKITSVAIYNGDTQLVEVTDGNVATYEAQNISNTVTYTAKVTDAKSKVVTATLNYTFVHPIYMGVCDSETPDAVAVKALDKVVTGKSNQAHTYTLSAAHMVCACPPGWTLKNIIDPNGFDITSSFKQVVVNLGDESAPVNYTVYVSGVTTQSGFKVTFNAA